MSLKTPPFIHFKIIQLIQKQDIFDDKTTKYIKLELMRTVESVTIQRTKNILL